MLSALLLLTLTLAPEETLVVPPVGEPIPAAATGPGAPRVTAPPGQGAPEA